MELSCWLWPDVSGEATEHRRRPWTNTIPSLPLSAIRLRPIFVLLSSTDPAKAIAVSSATNRLADLIPGATVKDVLSLVQDYNNHANVYKPEVMRSRLVLHNGNEYKVFFRFLKKKVLTAVLNTDHDVHYEILSPHRALSRSWTTRVQEVENPGKPDEREKPAGNDSGFMWRLDTWWRFEERDGGTYVQCETVSLSRDIPFGLGWMVGPFVKSIPKESLAFSLGTTRSTLMTRLAQANSSARPSPSN